MFNIIGKKYWYFAFSLLIIIPGLISLFLYGLNLSIEFTGGSNFTFSFPKELSSSKVQDLRNIFASNKIKVQAIEKSDKKLFVRSQVVDQKTDVAIISQLKSKFGNFKQEQYETVGPTIGSETTLNAIKALAIASVLIVLYITWSFRKVPKPASSFRFGICAIIALIHDVLVLLGIFSILGHFFWSAS